MDLITLKSGAGSAFTVASAACHGCGVRHAFLSAVGRELVRLDGVHQRGVSARGNRQSCHRQRTGCRDGRRRLQDAVAVVTQRIGLIRHRNNRCSTRRRGIRAQVIRQRQTRQRRRTGIDKLHGVGNRIAVLVGCRNRGLAHGQHLGQHARHHIGGNRLVVIRKRCLIRERCRHREIPPFPALSISFPGHFQAMPDVLRWCAKKSGALRYGYGSTPQVYAFFSADLTSRGSRRTHSPTSRYSAAVSGTNSTMPEMPIMPPPISTAASTHNPGSFNLLPTVWG